MAISFVNGKTHVVDGHGLAHAKLTASQIALLIAQALRDEVELKPCAAQLARGFGVSTSLVSLANKLAGSALEGEVGAGRYSIPKALSLLAKTAAPTVEPVIESPPVMAETKFPPMTITIDSAVELATVTASVMSGPELDRFIVAAGHARIFDRAVALAHA